MENYYQRVDKVLLDLVKSGRLLAIKAEFEAEGTRVDELAILSQFCKNHNVPLTLKIGGPLARRDIYEAFQLGATNILAPMVESSFALEYLFRIFRSVRSVFKRSDHCPSLLINIESKVSYYRFEEILDTIKSSEIDVVGIVIGRSDMASSFDNEDVNSSEIYDIALDILERCNRFDLKVTVGGSITNSSQGFIKQLSKLGLYGFESRKCTFKADSMMTPEDYKFLVDFGLGFELGWLEYKKYLYKARSNQDDMRIDSINSRLKQ